MNILFEDSNLRIYNKLIINKNYYLIEALKIAYVITGLDKKSLIIFYLDDEVFWIFILSSTNFLINEMIFIIVLYL